MAPPKSTPEKWEALPPRAFKINIDGATIEAENAMGLGTVIRDYRGRFVTTKTRKVIGVVDVMRAEAMAIREGVSLAKELGIRSVILEGEAKIVLVSFECSSANLSRNELILAYAYRLVSWFNFLLATLI